MNVATKDKSAGDVETLLHKTISSRISDDESSDLNLFANQLGIAENRRVTASEIVRIAIKEYIEKHRPELKAHMKGMKP